MSTARSVCSASGAILIIFLFYFVFCFVAHLFTSRVERVPLPHIEQPRFWSTAPEIVDVIVSRPASGGFSSNEEFCQLLQARLVQLRGEIAIVQCRFQHIPSVADDPNTADVALKDFASTDSISWFFLGDHDTKHEITLGHFNHAWSMQGDLDEEIWIDNSLAAFSRMLTGADSGRSEHIQSQKSYLLSFSVLVEDPSEVNHLWDFKQVVSDYLRPFLDKIRPVFNTRVDSQIIYYTDIDDHVQTKKDGSKFLSRSQLNDFMGRTKWNVGSIHTPSFPALQFFIYIPLPIHTPLLFESDGQSSPAFSIPRWGGLTIANPLARPDATVDDFGSIMPIVLAQIRMMLGFPDPLWSSSDVNTRQVVSDVGVADWELRLMQRTRLQHNYYDGYERLHALMRLLDENLQLPVQPHVGDLIQQAVTNLNRCMDSVQNGHYDEAYDLCLDGYSAANSAFFDEAMLPLLYFPDEHVYAVYAPYFLSIFSVTLSRTVQFIKGLRRKDPTSVSTS